jgi:hypothetical protein
VLDLEKNKFDNGEGGVEPGKPVVFVPEHYIDEQDRRTQVLDAFSDSIKELLNAGKKVYLVYPVPEVGWDVPRQAFKQKFKGIDEPVSTSANLYYQRSKAVIEKFDALPDSDKLIRIHPGKMFCNTLLPGRCVTELNGKILYADDDHLSENGANLIMNEIRESIENK